MAIIGVDLGTDSMKIISILDEVNEIQAMEIFPLNNEFHSSDYIGEVKKNINAFCKKHNIKKATLNMSIPILDDVAFYKIITLPPLKKKLADKSIRYELEDSNELVLNNYYYKWNVAGENKEKKLQTLNVVGIDKSLINKIADIGTLKYKIDHLEVGFNTIGRNLHGNKIAIDFGHSSTRIYTYKEDIPFLFKTISISGKDIDLEIEKALNQKLSKDDLLEIKRAINLKQEEFENEKEKKIHELILKKIDELIEEIVRYVRSIEVQYDLYIEVVNYIGGLILINGFKEKLEDALMLDCVPLSVNSLNDVLSKSEMSLFYNTLSVLSHKTNPYYSQLYFGKYVKKQMDYSSVFIATICACLLVQYAAIDVNRRYDEKIIEIQNLADHQNTRVVDLEQRIQTYNSMIQENENFVNQIYSMKDNKTLLSKMLYVLSEDTPKAISLIDIYLQEGQLNLEGYSEDYSSIGFLSKSLEEYGEFKIESISGIEEEIYSENGRKMTQKFVASLTFDNKNVFLTQSKIEQINEESSKEKELIQQIKDNLDKVYEINSNWSDKFDKKDSGQPINPDDTTNIPEDEINPNDTTNIPEEEINPDNPTYLEKIPQRP